MNIITNFTRVEQILAPYQNIIKNDMLGYRNHVTRMLNFCHYLLPQISEQDSQKLQIAAAFHDIALWTHDTVDYLVPSYQLCNQYLIDNDLAHWQQEIQIIIDMHHLLHQYQGPYQQLTEVFRQADLVDFSLGVIKNGISRDFIQAVKQALPNGGFHRTLMRFTIQQLKRNPLNPMPMLRIKNNYRNLKN